MKDLYNIIKNSNVSHCETYSLLIQLYDIDIVNFIMYDMYGYKYDPNNDDILKLKNHRVGQEEFRDGLIKRYKKCIITNDNASVCEACHIIPYEICKNYKIDNGLLLTASIHKLFDNYELTIDDKTHKVRLNNGKKFNNYQKYDGMFIKGISKQTSSYLAEHNKDFKDKQSFLR